MYKSQTTWYLVEYNDAVDYDIFSFFYRYFFSLGKTRVKERTVTPVLKEDRSSYPLTLSESFKKVFRYFPMIIKFSHGQMIF